MKQKCHCVLMSESCAYVLCSFCKNIFYRATSFSHSQICSLMRGGIAERGGVRVGHRIIEINGQSVVAMAHEKIVQTLSVSVGEVRTPCAAKWQLSMITALHESLNLFKDTHTVEKAVQG